MKADNISLVQEYGGGKAEWYIRARLDAGSVKDAQNAYDELCGKDVSIEIKRWRDKRSLDANAYCWVLCGRIAEALDGDKEDIYREAIRSAGVVELAPVKNEQVEELIARWDKVGIGFFAEEWQPCKKEGYTYVNKYYGSHTYDTAEMSRLLRYIVEEAQGLDIETKTPDELARMEALWQQKNTA